MRLLRRLLRRSLRGKRRPRELEWRRLVLAIRKVQQGQLALAQRVEDLTVRRAVPPALDFASMQEELRVLKTLLIRIDQLGLEQLERIGQLVAASRADPGSAARQAELEAELETLKNEHTCEREALRRANAEVTALGERLRASELARVEFEAKHTSELSQIADHARHQIERLEDELKKRKRGLSALTEQNIQLQTALDELRRSAERRTEPPTPVPDGPPPALPKGKKRAAKPEE